MVGELYTYDDRLAMESRLFEGAHVYAVAKGR